MPLSDADVDSAVQIVVKRMYGDTGATANLNTADIRAAVTVIDLEFEVAISTIADQTRSIQAHLNFSLPDPFRSVASTVDKGTLVAVVIGKKTGVL
jgi:hypothetical protein